MVAIPTAGRHRSVGRPAAGAAGNSSATCLDTLTVRPAEALRVVVVAGGEGKGTREDDREGREASGVPGSKDMVACCKRAPFGGSLAAVGTEYDNDKRPPSLSTRRYGQLGETDTIPRPGTAAKRGCEEFVWKRRLMEPRVELGSWRRRTLDDMRVRGGGSDLNSGGLRRECFRSC